MKTIKEILSSKGMLLFLLMLIISTFLYVRDVNALENTSVELDFSKIENPWNLSEKIIFTFDNDQTSKIYSHISIKDNKLYVFYYDKKFEYSEITGKYSSASQALAVKLYTFNSSTKKFDYFSSTTWNGTEFSETNVIWSSYKFVVKNTFPNLSYIYNGLDTFLKDNPKYIEILKYLIEKMDETKYKYIVYLNKDGDSYRLFIQFSKEEFYIQYKDNNLRSTGTSCVLGNAAYGGDVFGIYPNSGNNWELTKEKIDKYTNDLKINGDNWLSNGGSSSFLNKSYFQPTNDYQYFYTILFYSSMNKKSIDVKDYSAFTYSELNGQMMGYAFPTFTGFYQDYDFVEEIPPDFDYKDMPDISTDGEEQEIDTTDPEKIIEGNDVKKSAFNLVSFLLDQFPIYKQMRTISERWRYYDSDCIKLGNMNEPYTKRCLILDNLKFTLFNHEYDLPGLDVTWYLQYRNMIDFFIKLSIGILTALKSLHIIQGMFHGK